MRFGYWWILLAVFTLEIVVAIFAPVPAAQAPLDTHVLVLFSLTFLMVVFDIQALLLWISGRSLGWAVTWQDSLKYTGITWSVLLVEDIVTFYWAVKGQNTVVLVLGFPFFIWYVAALAIGVRAVSGCTGGRAFAIALLASVPWRAGLLWLYWMNMQ